MYDEEFRHEEAINSAKEHYMAEKEVDCETLRAKSFRLREEEVSMIEVVINLWSFKLDITHPIFWVHDIGRIFLQMKH